MQNDSSAQFPAEFRPEPERVDFNSVKIQLLAGFLLILIACLSGYACSLKIGFLLDDYLHLDYAARAACGNWQLFLNNFTGNWAGSDVMKSYRPLTSLSILMDYLLWGTNAFGYHLTNLLLFFACCLFVSLITLELTGLTGNRLGAAAAVWSGLAFAVYPLHPESVCWVIGRVDLLCALFYLASVWAYLRFVLLEERAYLTGSLILFLLALLSKEMAVTLPAVITLAELCLRPATGAIYCRDNKCTGNITSFAPATNNSDTAAGKIRLSKRVKLVLSFWLLLAVYAIFRSAILGTLVGGYASAAGPVNPWKAFSWNIFKVFFDYPSLTKIFFPANEEMPVPAFIAPLLSTCYIAGLLTLALRLALHSPRARIFFFLAGWAVIAVLPTFQIWHIYPNLVGSRLFYLSSAPLCMMIPLAVLPAIDAIKKKQAIAASAAASLILLVIYLSWAQLLRLNMQPWLAAGNIMGDLREQVTEIASRLPPGKRVLMLNLPADYKGAGLLTKGQYLAILSNRPFCRFNFSDRLFTLEPPAAGSAAFSWSDALRKALARKDLYAVYDWDTAEQCFVPWRQPAGAKSYDFQVSGTDLSSVEIEPAGTVVTTALRWTDLPTGNGFVEKHLDFLRLFAGKNGVTILFPQAQLNPIACSSIWLTCKAHNSAGKSLKISGKVKMIWQSARHGTGNRYRETVATEAGQGGYHLLVGRLKSWEMSGTVHRLGLHLQPSDILLDLYGISTEPNNHH